MKKIIITTTIIISSLLSIHAQKQTNYKKTIGNEKYYTENINIEQQKPTEQPKIKITFNKNWKTTIILILPIILIVGIITKYQKELITILKTPFDKNLNKQLLSQQNNTIKNIIITLNFLFFIIITGIITHYINNKNIFEKTNKYIIPIATIAGITLFYYLKKLLTFISSKIFDSKKFYNNYIFTTQIINSVSATIIFFAIFIIHYNPYIPITTIYYLPIITIILFILRIIDIFREFFSKGFLFFYLILYLCTVEILPVLIIAKKLLS